MKLVVGLGNPGRQYAHTRHNVGFDVIDLLAKRHRTKVLARQCHSLVGSFEHFGEQVILAKPQTYMNESGMAVGELARRHRIDPADIIVIYDDMDLPLGKLRIRPKGSSGGHKGMNSIIHHIHSTEFPRIRIGIGRGGEVINHVLSRFNRKDRENIDVTLEQSADAIEKIIDDGIEAAMNLFNRVGEE